MEATTGVMCRLDEDVIVRAWDRFLEAQTRILGPQELVWLDHHHALKHNVLEVGSGRGHYGAFLAEYASDRYFMGLEANDDLIDCGRVLPGNYKIERCRVGVDPFPSKLYNQFNTCLLRFVLQHSPDPKQLLSTLFDALPAGARIFIIEEDERLLLSNGKYPPWDAAIRIWKRVYCSGGSNSQMGLELPSVVESAGFKIEDYSIVLRNNIEMQSDFIEFFTACSSLFSQISPELVSEQELSLIRDGFSEVPPPGYVATYPQVMLVAKK